MMPIRCRHPECTYEYMPHKKDSKLFRMFVEIGGGDGELRHHASFSTFPGGVTLNNVLSLCDKRLNIFYLAVRCLRLHCKVYHFDYEVPSYLLPPRTIDPVSMQLKNNKRSLDLFKDRLRATRYRKKKMKNSRAFRLAAGAKNFKMRTPRIKFLTKNYTLIEWLSWVEALGAYPENVEMLGMKKKWVPGPPVGTDAQTIDLHGSEFEVNMQDQSGKRLGKIG